MATSGPKRAFPTSAAVERAAVGFQEMSQRFPLFPSNDGGAFIPYFNTFFVIGVPIRSLRSVSASSGRLERWVLGLQYLRGWRMCRLWVDARCLLQCAHRLGDQRLL
jgi:hypothetical protein